MAEIATYKCSNPLCSLVVRLARDFPVWHEHTPKELRTPAVHSSAQAYLARYRSESFCTRCKKVVEYTAANTCSLCEGEVQTEHLGRACPRCATGSLSMPQLMVY